jgi:hypothetical protein
MPASPTDRIIAFTEFCGGLMRPVYEDADGGQYVHDDDGEIVRGNWWMPRDLPDEPLIVESMD